MEERLRSGRSTHPKHSL